jgi:formylglycine-generating enzyme required for sulfatase activity
MPFRLAATEVTQAEYEQVMGTNPSHFSRTGNGNDKLAGLDPRRFPVEQVSWYDAAEFCNKLSSREGLPAYYELSDIERKEGSIQSATVGLRSNNGYRLPTEAEWEYACRAGTTTPFHFGEINNGQEANINGDYPYGTSTKGPYLERTTTVGSYGANGFGLRDMHGNVLEWCNDWYDAKIYDQAANIAIDPLGPVSGNLRVLRGGSWSNYDARFSRSALRYWSTPVIRSSLIGFRVSRTE